MANRSFNLYQIAGLLLGATCITAPLSAATLLEFDFASSTANIYSPSVNTLTGTTPRASINAGAHEEWGTDNWGNEPIHGSGQTLAYAPWVPADSWQFTLNADTTGFENMTLSFKYVFEGAAATLAAEYSVGGSWTSLNPPALNGGNVGSLYSVDLSAISAVENTQNVAFRFTLTNHDAVMKVDDLALVGTAVPEPAMLGLALLVPVGLLRRRRA